MYNKTITPVYTKIPNEINFELRQFKEHES